MKPLRLLCLLLVPLFLAACGLTDQQKADYASVQRSGVSSATYDKMLHGDSLSIADVENLTHARVNDGVILRYMRDQGTVYTLNTNDVVGLRKAGVLQSIIDYMLQSARYYDNDPYLYPYGYGYDPFWYGPYGPGFYGGFGYHHWHGGGYHGGYHHH
jgi:hypothetical protein